MEENLQEVRRQEKETYQKLQQKFPDQMKRQSLSSPSEVLPLIGIENVAGSPAGFIRLYPEDFIVEEVAHDNIICTIEPASNEISPNISKNQTLYANLVKVGIGTTEAQQDLAHTLKINPQQISYSGLKDSRALTSQRIGIRGLDHIPQLPTKQYFLNLLSIGKGALAPGQLQGNCFTMTIRTQEQPIQEELIRKAQHLQDYGFPNFYGSQRFGNRLLNPLLGKLLAQGNREEAVKTFLCKSGPNDLPIIATIRKNAATHWGSWEKMDSTFNLLPYTFRHEKKMLRSLIQNHSEWDKAIASISDQATFWIYGYTSFLVNKLLSRAYQGQQEIPDPLPLPLGDKETDKIYQSYLEEDGTLNYTQHLRSHRFFIRKMRTIKPWIFPTIHYLHCIEKMTLISFSLPKAAYATTFLMFLFDIYEGTPVPQWVTTEKIDSKHILGIGSATSALEKLDTSLVTSLLPEENK